MEIKDVVNTIKTWNTESKSLEELENEYLSWLFLECQSTKSLIQLFLLSVIPSLTIFFQISIRL